MPNVIKKLDFTLETAADPYTAVPSGWAYSVGSQQGRTTNISAMSWAAKSVQSNIVDNVSMQGTLIKSTVQLSTSQANPSGACILDASGNGYQVIADTTNGHRLYKTVAGQLSGSPLLQITQATTPVVNLQKHSLVRNTSTNELQILIEGTLAGSVTDATYSPTYGGGCSRFGYLRYIETEYTPIQSITSINGGLPITASQSSVSAVTAGFTGLPTSITCSPSSITCGSITGTTNNPSWIQTVRTDGAVFPKSGTVVTYTFTKGAESASLTQVVNKDATETEVTVASPVLNDNAYVYSAIKTATGRTAVDGDINYYTVPAGMSDLVVAADGRITVTNAGTFTMWVWTLATGVNYRYDVTVSDGGAVVSVSKFIGATISGKILTGSFLKGKLL